MMKKKKSEEQFESEQKVTATRQKNDHYKLKSVRTASINSPHISDHFIFGVNCKWRALLNELIKKLRAPLVFVRS
jgi:hypothetical protein